MINTVTAPNDPRITVKVAELAVGDFLTASQCTIIEKPFDSVDCPRGCTNVVVQYSNGKTSRRVWNKSTTMKIVRNPK